MMKPIYCPNCKALLFKTDFCDVEIVCRKCDRLVTIKFYTKSALLLKAEEKGDKIETVKRS